MIFFLHLRVQVSQKLESKEAEVHLTTSSPPLQQQVIRKLIVVTLVTLATTALLLLPQLAVAAAVAAMAVMADHQQLANQFNTLDQRENNCQL